MIRSDEQHWLNSASTDFIRSLKSFVHLKTETKKTLSKQITSLTLITCSLKLKWWLSLVFSGVCLLLLVLTEDRQKARSWPSIRTQPGADCPQARFDIQMRCRFHTVCSTHTHTHTHRFSGKCDPTAHGGDVLPFCLSRAIRKFQFIFQCAGGGQQESLRLYIHFRFLGRRVTAGRSRLRCCSSVRLPRICVAHKAALLPRPPLSPPLSPPLPSPPLPPPESTTSCCGLKGQSSIYTQTPNKRRELQLGGAPKLPQTPSETSVQD